ncbi:hypothetical protein Vafri_19175 [Volvox africanus]|uniref:Uncharacterized protein n=1 Tax=Volvox africanus TaxID=51714 RepID=A0A8J4BP00_9CHLO|nr:hypothetical protein Vafri_19175 [Volvox africanus]
MREEAVKGPQAAEWRQAMEEEMAAQYANHTSRWELTKPPPGVKLLVGGFIPLRRMMVVALSVSRHAWWPRDFSSARASIMVSFLLRPPGLPRCGRCGRRRRLRCMTSISWTSQPFS